MNDAPQSAASAAPNFELQRGWRVLFAVSLGVAVGLGGFFTYTDGLFAVAIHDDLGWSMRDLAASRLIIGLGTALSAPIIGLAVDRFGTVPVVTVGVFAFALAYLGFATMPNNFQIYLSLTLWLALLGPAATIVGYAKPIRDIFQRRLGFALGVILAASGLMGAISPIAVNYINQAHGWRVGYMSIAAVGFFVGLTAIALLRGAMKQPEFAAATTPSATGPKARYIEMLASREFWLILVSFCTIGVAITGFAFHLPNILRGYGMSQQQIGLAQACLGIGVLSVRFLIGIALDYAPTLLVIAATMAVSAIGFVLLALGGPPFAIAAAVLIGLGIGAEVDFLGYLAARYFPRTLFGRAFGLLYGIVVIAVGASPFLISTLAQGPHGYTTALFVCAAMLVPAVGLLFFMRRTPPLESPVAA